MAISNKPRQKKDHPSKSTKVAQATASAKPSQRLYLGLIVLLTFVVYGNSIPNQYALDDLYAITGNSYTQQGFAGIPSLLSKDFFAGYFKDKEVILAGGRYRPLSLVTYAIEYQLFGSNPRVNHFFNVLLFGILGCLLFLFLRQLKSDEKKTPWYKHFALVGSLVFIVHPIHTEVVANIKGRDEILSLLGSLGTALLYFKYLDTTKNKYLIYSFLSFFLAAMSKENALLFVGLIPLSVYYFKKFDLKKNFLASLPLVIAALLFLLLRWNALGGLTSRPSAELLDNPFVQATLSQKYATIMLTLGYYLKLLFIPHPLTWDYYPYHIPLAGWGNLRVILSVLIYVLLLVVAVAGIRKRWLPSYAIWFFLVCIFLVSNIVFPVGVFMAERFLFTPSVVFCMVFSWLVVYQIPGISKLNISMQKRFIPLFLLLVLGLYSIKTIGRNPVWKDDYTLYTTDVETSANSAKSNNIAGQWFAWAAKQPENSGRRDELYTKALVHLRKAVKIHPVFQDALFHLGNVQYDYRNDMDSTLQCYYTLLRLNPEENNVYKNLGLLLPRIEDETVQIKRWQEVLRFNPERFEPNYHLGRLLAGKDLSGAVRYLEAARQKRPGDPDLLAALGNAYVNLKQYDKAESCYEEYLKITPENTEIQQYLETVRKLK